MAETVLHSIFNDVLDPIMAGPSSSHSAGCTRIGLTVHHLFGREIKKAVVIFDAAGSYPATCIGQGSNFGFPAFIDGSCRLSFVKCMIFVKEQIQSQIERKFTAVSVEQSDVDDKDICLLILKGLTEEQEEELDAFQSYPGILSIRHTGMVLPVGMRSGENKAIFHNADGALEYSKQCSLDAEELAIAYETSVGEITKEEVINLAKHTYDIMRHAATTPPDPEKEEKFGFLPYQCQDMMAKLEGKKIELAPTGCLDKALFYAVSVMENSCAHNTVVASPTAGSSGVVPAANMVILGFDPKIPLDETIECMLRVGQALPESLRCTCGGGVCTTPTGLCLGNPRRN